MQTLRALLSVCTCASLAGPALAELSEDDHALLGCAAQALVLSSFLSEIVEAGADVPADLVNGADGAALGLLEVAQPLFADGVGGNAAMSAAVDEAATSLGTARTDGTTTQWFGQTVTLVRDCESAHVMAGEAIQ